jgi:hypothetical protein
MPIIGKMKRLLIVFLAAAGFVLPLFSSPLTFDPAYRKTDDQGRGLLLVRGEPLSVERILGLSPWDLMDLVQTLSGVPQRLSDYGNGGDDPVTQAWRTQVATFAAAADLPKAVPQEDLYDPALVLWDPGYIQNLNSWGQWTIRIARRDIVQADLPTLSPLEVQQAVEVLTGRTYPVEFVLDHLEAFRAQLSVVPRLAEALAVHP